MCLQIYPLTLLATNFVCQRYKHGKIFMPSCLHALSTLLASMLLAPPASMLLAPSYPHGLSNFSTSPLCAGDSTHVFPSGFRAIDLICQLAAPIVIGLLMTFTSPLIATLLLLAYTMLVWAPELHFFQRAVDLSPALRCVPVSSLMKC